MTEKELKDYVFKKVEELGPEEARTYLINKIETSDDYDFIIAAARYGRTVIEAIIEAGIKTVR